MTFLLKSPRVQIAFRLSTIVNGNLLMLSKYFIIFEIIHLFTALFMPQVFAKWLSVGISSIIKAGSLFPKLSEGSRHEAREL